MNKQKKELPQNALPKREIRTEKTELHVRNQHRTRYDFKKLTAASESLIPFVTVNKFGDESVDFSNPAAVIALNKAILKLHYGIDYWDLPSNYLCPPIPGRADYIHHVADLLADSNKGKIPRGENVRVMDIGTGSSCIFSIIGNKEYGWSFVGTDIDKTALESAGKIIANNKSLRNVILLRQQSNPRNILYGMFMKNELFDLTICNPPFHSSMEEAQEASLRKVTNLKGKKINKPISNFGGQSNELWCEGGEARFIKDMIFQSKQFADSCFWFTTLVSKQSNLKRIYDYLKRVEATDVKTISMAQGNKIGRIVAWTFLTAERKQIWIKERW
jgi:23S rRNA (adenine1618-N6)-methyltransferase